ncbi:MAG: ribose transport system substrate-binding protein [Flavobacteriales bacterium]|jgi:ribose transport system substrate-binding protein
MYFIRVFIFALTTLVLCACDDQSNSGSSNTNNADAEQKPTVALIMKSLANEFFVNMADGAKAHSREHASEYKLIVNGIKNESDLAQQVALVDQMVAMGADVIIIAPADSKALVPALVRAKRAGVIIVNIDNRLDPAVLADFNVKIPYIGPSNKDGAKLVGDYVLKDYPAGTQVAILEGIPTAYNSIQRREGFESAVEAAKLNLVTVQSASWESTKAAEITAAIISQHPELKVILAANDNMALGAASAIHLANIDHHIDVAGFDNISAIHQLIRDGQIKATAEQYGDKFAIYGIEFALAALTGGPSDVDKQTPVDLITAADIADK